jgi:ribonucleoside-diphosphate reductase alpha chain
MRICKRWPSSRTDDPEIPRVRSVIDYVARRLAIDWLPHSERAGLGIFTIAERMDAAQAWMDAEDTLLSRTVRGDAGLDAFRWEIATGIGAPAPG